MITQLQRMRHVFIIFWPPQIVGDTARNLAYDDDFHLFSLRKAQRPLRLLLRVKSGPRPGSLLFHHLMQTTSMEFKQPSLQLPFPAPLQL